MDQSTTVHSDSTPILPSVLAVGAIAATLLVALLWTDVNIIEN